MSRFAALKSDDDNENEEDYSDAGTPLDMLKPQYSIKRILEIYKDAPKGLNSIGDQIKKLDSIFVRASQAPECFSFKPPTSEINSTIYLPGKTQTKQNPVQQPKKGQQKTKQQQPKKQQVPPPVSQTSIKPLPKYDESGTMWLYKDPVDHVLGPYPSAKMREWFENRYFDKTLLVRQYNAEGRFQTIAATFPDISMAFRDVVKPKNVDEQQDSSENEMKKNSDTLFSFALSAKEENEIAELLKLK